MLRTTDFIEIYDDALAPGECERIIEHFEQSRHISPGLIGNGEVVKEIKNSDDITISNHPEWSDINSLLNACALTALARYLRRYPYLLLGPFTICSRDSAGNAIKRLQPHTIATMSDPELANLAKHFLDLGTINVQRYRATTGGYPRWHSEIFPAAAPEARTMSRTLFWIIYLNDTFSAGETEFLHLKRKVQPRRGRLIMAPAHFTHTHRGNRPLNGDKYIATSWVLFR